MWTRLSRLSAADTMDSHSAKDLKQELIPTVWELPLTRSAHMHLRAAAVRVQLQSGELQGMLRILAGA